MDYHLTREEILAMVAKGKRLRDANVGDKADPRKADLSGAHLRNANYSTATIWPEGFDPEAAGVVLVED